MAASNGLAVTTVQSGGMGSAMLARYFRGGLEVLGFEPSRYKIDGMAPFAMRFR